MVSWREKLCGNPISCLLEYDSDQPAVRYFTLIDILDLNGNNINVKQKGQPSKWITLRALRVLKEAYPEAK